MYVYVGIERGSTIDNVCISMYVHMYYVCRYSMVYRVGRAITALSCCLTRPSEVLVGLVDHSVICIDIG